MLIILTFDGKHRWIAYTVELARAKLPENAGNFTCGSYVKRPHMQFTCITCSLPVKQVNLPAPTRQALHAEYTRIASTRREIYINIAGILQIILQAVVMQICPRLAYKIACFCNQK